MAMPNRRSQFEFDLSGGNPCLDFANTVSGRKDPEGLIDHINRYADLVVFAEQSRLISSQQSDDLLARAQRNGSDANRALQRSIALRASVFGAFSAIADGKSASQHDLRRIEEAALQALRHRKLAGTNGRYQWEWEAGGKDSLDRPMWPIAQAAAELLTSGELRGVRECEAPTCAWLFLDQSRNHSRRWCDMKVCGNRQKARRHYQRTHV
jgi:predicted RNA-binding Zn ribbon-like protein